MQIFGITLNRYSIPIIYLACAIVGFLLIRESIHMFQHPIATRAISVWLGVGFIALSLPAVYSNKIPLPRQASILLIIWLAWTLLSTLLGEQPWAAMVRWFEILTSISIALCLYFIINKQPELITLLAKSIVAAVLLCLLAFVVYWNLLSSPVKHNWGSDIPFFVNIRHFGQLITVAVPLAYYLLHKYTSDKKNTHGIIGYLILSWALVFWLGGRGTFLAVVITSILYIPIACKSARKWILITPFIGVILSQFFIVEHPSLNLFRLIAQDGISLNAYSSFREVIYIESLIHWWKQAPIMGIGADGYRYLIPAIGNVDSIAHPHSSIIQLLLSFGPIGLLIPTYFFFILTWKVIKTSTAEQHLTADNIKTFYLILLSTLILSLFDGILYHAYGLFISSIVTGICVAIAFPQKVNTALDNTEFSKKPSQYSTLFTLILGIIVTTGYYAIFTYQLHHSKYGSKNEEWINWNARYPVYFSPTWTYQRYKAEDIEQLKQDYIKRQNADNNKTPTTSNNSL
jgi:hypothetical protein